MVKKGADKSHNVTGSDIGNPPVANVRKHVTMERALPRGKCCIGRPARGANGKELAGSLGKRRNRPAGTHNKRIATVGDQRAPASREGEGRARRCSNFRLRSKRTLEQVRVRCRGRNR